MSNDANALYKKKFFVGGGGFFLQFSSMWGDVEQAQGEVEDGGGEGGGTHDPFLHLIYNLYKYHLWFFNKKDIFISELQLYDLISLACLSSSSFYFYPCFCMYVFFFLEVWILKGNLRKALHIFFFFM